MWGKYMKMKKRNYPRKNVIMSVAYEMGQIGINKRCKSFNGDIENISTGGVCIITNNAFDPGRVAMLNLKVEDTDIRLPAFAEVKWTKPVGYKGKYRIGFQFLR